MVAKRYYLAFGSDCLNRMKGEGSQISSLTQRMLEKVSTPSRRYLRRPEGNGVSDTELILIALLTDAVRTIAGGGKGGSGKGRSYP
jgi:hypothetical protein